MLRLSEKRVRNHVASGLTTLRTRNRAALVARTRDAGLAGP